MLTFSALFSACAPTAFQASMFTQLGLRRVKRKTASCPNLRDILPLQRRQAEMREKIGGLNEEEELKERG